MNNSIMPIGSNTSFEKRKMRKITKLTLRRRDKDTKEYLPSIEQKNLNMTKNNMILTPDRWSPTGWKYKLKNQHRLYNEYKSTDPHNKSWLHGIPNELVHLLYNHRTI